MGTGGEAAAPRVDDVPLARLALAAARGVAGVVGISRGRFAVARTFGLGGEAVEGVQVTPTAGGVLVELHLVVRPVPIPPLADAVRAAVAAAAERAGARVVAVDIWVDALREEAEEGDA